jgi:hypothetical protein
MEKLNEKIDDSTIILFHYKARYGELEKYVVRLAVKKLDPSPEPGFHNYQEEVERHEYFVKNCPNAREIAIEQFRQITTRVSLSSTSL